MKQITLESELTAHIIDNFSKYFDFSFVSKEAFVTSGRIDILGEDEHNIYIIEVKRDFVTNSSIEQLQNYVRNYQTTKNIIGIAAAPKISDDVDLTSIHTDIWIHEIKDVEFVPNPNAKVRAAISLDEDVYEYIRKAASMDGRSVSQYINRTLKLQLLSGEK